MPGTRLFEKVPFFPLLFGVPFSVTDWSRGGRGRKIVAAAAKTMLLEEPEKK